MKNASSVFLLSVVIAFAAFVSGVFFGRVTAEPKVYYTAQSSATENSDASIIDGKLNINTASVDDLTMLPGIGDTLAQRIIDYRESIGAFTSLEQLLDVSGIGTVKLNAVIEYLTVGG